jgi:hypothetical protein
VSEEAELELLELEEAEARAKASAKPRKSLAEEVVRTAVPGVAQTLETAQPLLDSAAAARGPSAGEVAGAVLGAQTMGAQLAGQGIGDVLMSGFRLAGSLIPGMRGKVKDEKTGQERTRTIKEAAQNPAGSLTTPIREAIHKRAPEPVAMAADAAIMGAEGALVGAGAGAARNITAKIAGATGRGLEGAGNKLQNIRLKAAAADFKNGYRPQTMFDYGLVEKPSGGIKAALTGESIQGAFNRIEEKFNQIGPERTAILEKNPAKVDVNAIFSKVRERINEQGKSESRFPRLRQMNEALEHYQTELNQVLPRIERMPQAARRPVESLSPQELQAGLKDGTLKFGGTGGKPKVEYATPEATPEAMPFRFADANLLQANRFKTAMGDEASFQHIATNDRSGARLNQNASAYEEVANMLYQELRGTVDRAGGARAQAISRDFSDLIPVRGVLIKSMTREQLAGLHPQLAQSIGSRSSVLGLLTRGLPGLGSRLTHGVGTGLQEAAVIPAMGPVSAAAGRGARTMFRYGALAGSLAPQAQE